MKKLILVIVLIIAVVADNNNCWKDAYGRGVGKPISTCREGYEKDGALCYPKCKEGYYGVGPVCW